MKWLKFAVVIQIAIIAYGCNKNKCQDFYELNNIELFNYKLQDIKNVKITAYAKNGSQIVQDSFEIVKFQKIDSQGYDNDVFLNKRINTNYDYDIYFKDLNQHCKITGIKIRKELCKDGLFSNDYSYSFEEYYMNGSIFKCQVLKAAP